MMNHESRSSRALARAKAGFRRRRRDAGAVMFIVAMTLAVIAAMGMYALNVAATEVKTAGFVRQEMQVHYLSEFAVLGAAQTVGGPTSGMYALQARNSPATNCVSIYGTPTTAGTLPLACRTLGSADMGATWTPPIAPLAAWSANASETTRGSVGLPMAPDFYVELTDPNPLPVGRCATGFDTSQNLCCMEFTATAIGFSQLTAGSYISEGLEMSRSRIIAGPTNIGCH
jgi:hypothetical protein